MRIPELLRVVAAADRLHRVAGHTTGAVSLLSLFRALKGIHLHGVDGPAPADARVWVALEPGRATLVYNRSWPLVRRRSALASGLGHVVLHSSAISNEYTLAGWHHGSPEELRLQTWFFAMILLAPAEAIYEVVPEEQRHDIVEDLDDLRVRRVARHLLVPPIHAAAALAFHLGLDLFVDQAQAFTEQALRDHPYYAVGHSE